MPTYEQTTTTFIWPANVPPEYLEGTVWAKFALRAGYPYWIEFERVVGGTWRATNAPRLSGIGSCAYTWAELLQKFKAVHTRPEYAK